jgi:hypothetical protein
MAIDLAVMRKRLEEKQAELQQHIAALTGSPAPPQDAIQASDGVVEPDEKLPLATMAAALPLLFSVVG